MSDRRAPAVAVASRPLGDLDHQRLIAGDLDPPGGASAVGK
jgi:hypothetical protein